MKPIQRFLLVLVLAFGIFLPVANPQPVRAEGQYGYLWSLFFDFEQSFDGILTIEVGPWENGDLTAVEATSTVTVPCKRVGNVQLNGGDAVFSGSGYLSCTLNLAETVWNNHKLAIGKVDTYGSMVMRARVNGATNTVAPLFSHPNAAYRLDFTQTSATTLSQTLWNGVGPLQATFPGVTINNWQTYTAQYICSIAGPCSASFAAGPQQQNQPTAGTRVQFATGPTTFEIGHGGGLFFSGRIASLLVDPGNSAH
ncbi:MAG TPA: hypothetical protein PKE45_13335 [Caldilineaceae bacterium]|nr:hypothetical protein [Caldilineaceae bacterium]